MFGLDLIRAVIAVRLARWFHLSNSFMYNEKADNCSHSALLQFTSSRLYSFRSATIPHAVGDASGYPI